jgi:hypothetical protein
VHPDGHRPEAGPIVVGLASGVGGVLLIGAMLRALSP